MNSPYGYEVSPEDQTLLTKPYQEMCQTDPMGLADLFFKSRLKKAYRDLPNFVKVYYTKPEAVTEGSLRDHPYFGEIYKGLERAVARYKNPADKSIAIYNHALTQGSISAMIAVSCETFQSALLMGSENKLSRVIELAEKYPEVSRYILNSDFKKDYLKNPDYFSDIKEMAEIDAVFALEALQDSEIKAKFLAEPFLNVFILKIVNKLYEKVLSIKEGPLDPKQMINILTLIGYISKDPNMPQSMRENAQMGFIKQKLIQQLHTLYTNAPESVEQAENKLRIA